MGRLAIAALLPVVAVAAACSPAGRETQSDRSPRYSFWRPSPVEGARDPAEVVKSAAAGEWRDVDPADLLVIDLADQSRIAIELAPLFAPVHVANVRALARAGWWDGAALYRVQDNYVAQWGVNESEKPLPGGVVDRPPPEYDRSLKGLTPRPLGFPDSYAPIAGHAGGWPIGYDPERGRAWLAHCYAMVGAGRSLAPDTGTGGELYAVIGQAPRHLDLNIALVGRVVDGIEALSARPRGTEPLGFYKERSSDIRIIRARLASDMPPAVRPAYQVLRSDSAAFSAYVAGRANRSGDFFQRAAGGVDLCNAPVPVRRKPVR
ncbi:MAG: peptidylprolyl isomerase [Alphaproteobacteria bacterium]|nr:peptidylprolyl isomerase [Alphaproteobacteria bacterium]